MFMKILVALAYGAMVAVNFLANSLPINNRSTGDISNAYPNLFAPAGFTFSIWGVIYLLLGAYIVYAFFQKEKKMETLYKKINPLFLATSVANICWIFAWHYDYIGLSVLIMAALLVLLIRIADLMRSATYNQTQQWLVRIPFSVYFGWITVAAIANVTVFLVSIGWNGFGISEALWTSIILVVGACIGIARLPKDKQMAYGLVLVWAYFGIFMKHISADGFAGLYTGVIGTVILCIAAFGYFLFRMRARTA